MSSDKVEFNSENLDEYLKELGKAIKKNAGKNADVELILIGGASILVNYSFRQKTFDFDVIVLPKSSAVEDAIRAVGNAKNLSKDWMNTDFVHTTNQTWKIAEATYFYVDNPVSYDNFEDAYAAIEKDYKDFTEIRGFEKIDLVELN